VQGACIQQLVNHSFFVLHTILSLRSLCVFIKSTGYISSVWSSVVSFFGYKSDQDISIDDNNVASTIVNNNSNVEQEPSDSACDSGSVEQNLDDSVESTEQKDKIVDVVNDTSPNYLEGIDVPSMTGLFHRHTRWPSAYAIHTILCTTALYTTMLQWLLLCVVVVASDLGY
jgi:hypothetical protein